MTEYNIYCFTGINQYKSSGYELKKMTLKTCFEKVFNTSYDDSMKTFFERHYSFDIRQKTVEDIFKMVSNKTTIIPFSVTVKRKEVLNYLDMGFNVVFMKPKEYQKMLKEYKNFC